MLKDGLVLIWELHMNLVLTLLLMCIKHQVEKTSVEKKTISEENTWWKNIVGGGQLVDGKVFVSGNFLVCGKTPYGENSTHLKHCELWKPGRWESPPEWKPTGRRRKSGGKMYLVKKAPGREITTKKHLVVENTWWWKTVGGGKHPESRNYLKNGGHLVGGKHLAEWK